MSVLQVLAYVSDVMDVGSAVDMANFTMEDVESNIVRCPDQEAAQKMIDGERGRGPWQHLSGVAAAAAGTAGAVAAAAAAVKELSVGSST